MRVKGGKPRTDTNLERRRRAFDALTTTQRQGRKRPGSTNRKKT